MYHCSFLFIIEWDSILWIYHTLFLHSSVGETLCPLHVSAIMNNVAINIYVEVFVWVYVFNSIEHIFRSRITGSYGISMFNWGLPNCFPHQPHNFVLCTFESLFVPSPDRVWHTETTNLLLGWMDDHFNPHPMPIQPGTGGCPTDQDGGLAPGPPMPPY